MRQFVADVSMASNTNARLSFFFAPSSSKRKYSLFLLVRHHALSSQKKKKLNTERRATKMIQGIFNVLH